MRASRFRSLLITLGAVVIALSGSTATTLGQVTITCLESDGDVVCSHPAGSLKTSSLSCVPNSHALGFMTPTDAAIMSGAGGPSDLCFGVISGPSSFGSGPFNFASFGSGSDVGLDATSVPDPTVAVYVPLRYVSESVLPAGSSTYSNTTLDGLGVTPGTYVWTWGNAGTTETMTLVAGAPPAVPAVTPIGMALFVLCFLAASSYILLARGGYHPNGPSRLRAYQRWESRG
jgi:hypothetical protein